MTSPGSSHQALDYAMSLMRGGNPQAARPVLAQILKQDPSNEAAWMMLSYALDDQDGQIRALKRVLQINPGNEKAQLRLNRLSPPPPSTPPFILEPEPAVPLYNVQSALKSAVASIKAGKRQAALTALTAVIEKDPDNEQAWLLFSYALSERGEQIEALQKTLQINPSNTRARERLLALTTGSQTRRVSVRPQTVRRPSSLILEETEPELSTWEQLQKGFVSGLKNMRFKRINWPLLFGSFLVVLIVFLAVQGPEMAPRNPMEENHILRLEDSWLVPPYAPGTEGFLLGSDQYGRDLLSQLLWAVRPTLVLVMLVASIRLGLGVVIGLSAGWVNGIMGSALNLLIQAALAIPVMLVALGVIARIGIDHGVWVFILALCFTGWADTAQVVRSQTQTVRSMEFVEAAYALGGSGGQILRNHILKHVTPLLFMLFSFEVGATMMATGGLGFLGYYLGGDALIQIDDFTQMRAASRPELGQMLATTLDITTEPFGMVAAGSMIFLVVLAFNLVGKGLRLRVGIKERRKSIFADALHVVRLWFSDRLVYPVEQVMRRAQRPLFVMGSVVVFAGIVGAGWWGVMLRPANGDAGGETAAAAIDLGEPVEEEVSLDAVAAKPELVWKSQLPDGNYSPPIVTPDGSVLIVNAENHLYRIGPSGGLLFEMQLEPGLYSYADSGFGGSRTVYVWPRVIAEDVLLVLTEEMAYGLDLMGNRLWEQPLETRPRDTFVHGPQGELYMVNRDGILLAFGAEGLLWQVDPPQYMRATNSWPVVTENGNIYYTLTNNTDGFIQAVSPEGEVLWFSEAADTINFHDEPQVSFNGDLVILDLDIFDGRTGELLQPEIPADISVDYYIFGQDGGWYFVGDNILREWQIEEGRMQILRSIALSFRTSATRFFFWPLINQAGEIALIFDHTVLDLIWMEPDGAVVGQGQVPERHDVVGFSDDFSVMTACGRNPDEGFYECITVEKGFENPAGYLPFEDLRRVRHYTYQADAALFSAMNTENFLYLYSLPE